MVSATDGISAFVERHGDRAAEVIWDAALVMLGQAVEAAGQGVRGRWRCYPAGELRRLRRDIAHALELARLAVALREEDRLQSAALNQDLTEAAAEAGRRSRRAQTLPAEKARLANAAARKATREALRAAE